MGHPGEAYSEVYPPMYHPQGGILWYIHPVTPLREAYSAVYTPVTPLREAYG